ncbi:MULTISPECIES: hypothetical protein [Kluyvera]|uniref:hypothetical protein n=1 Tax=Kluyvera sp. CHPC 1.2972 TaxID=2995176 RepID=UPI002FD7EF82
MRKLLWVVGLVALLSGCGDDGVYGTWKNAGTGLVIKIDEKNIKFPGVGNLAVDKWDVSKDQQTYVAHTTYNNISIEKSKGGIIIMGTEYQRE